MSNLTTLPLTSLSTKKLSYLSACITQASQAGQNNHIFTGSISRHGSVLVRNGKIIGQGHNNYRCRVKGVPNICSVHAEHACLLSHFGTQSRFLQGFERQYRQKRQGQQEKQELQRSQKPSRHLCCADFDRNFEAKQWGQPSKFKAVPPMSSALASV